MDLSQYAELFLTESREHVSALNHLLLALERGAGGDEAVSEIFRAVHTVKGMSATMGYAVVAELSHEMESLLDRIRRKAMVITPEVMDVLFRAADVLEQAVEASVGGRTDDVSTAPVLEQLRALGRPGAQLGHMPAAASPTGVPRWTAPAPHEISRAARSAGDVASVQVDDPAAGPSPARATAPPAPGGRHVRIDLRRLDALMNLIGELVIARGRLQQIGADLRDPSLDESLTQASRLIGDLRDEIVSSRMVPVGQVFDRFPRLVRDAARGLGKEIAFDIEGKDIELDRAILDEIGDPIVHLLRNAVDHGIELPDARARAGKLREGRLVLSAARERSSVVIRVSDDGAGIDRARVLAQAREAALVDAAKADLSDDELVRLVSRPGFSTADHVTGLSGRGVGVDAVVSRVRALGGSVDIKTQAGHGTTVTLRLPLTLAILRALLTRVDAEVYAVPMTHVCETVGLEVDRLRTLRGREVLTLRDAVLPLLRLRDIVGLPRSVVGAREQVIVLELAERRAALVVDGVAGQEEIVVKQYDPARSAVQAFSGVTILGAGAPALILDVGSLS